MVEYPDDNQYEWCSQESDEESNYDQEDGEMAQQKDDQKGVSGNQDEQGVISQ